MSEVLLKAEGITQQFGGLTALNNVDFELRKNEIVGIIGPNGAGKTTFFNIITGIYPPTAGTINYKGNNITGKKTYEITSMGISRTFQNIRLFDQMTVLENVMVGTHTHTNSGFLDAVFKTPRHHKTEKYVKEKAINLLEITGLSEYRYHYSTSLPYGFQRRLEIARAMANSPEVLLFDEPAAGMNENETRNLAQFITEINAMGYTILLIEHDMRLVMRICHRIYVLDHGTLIFQGTPEEVKRDPKVIEAYLGQEVE